MKRVSKCCKAALFVSPVSPDLVHKCTACGKECELTWERCHPIEPIQTENRDPENLSTR